ncbi:MAG: hypothetical protein ABJP33_04925, partial [Pseudoruegeria sp.]
QASAIAGVTPGIFDAGQLDVLIKAQRDNDDEKVRFILSQGADFGKNTLNNSNITGGKIQLANLAGVDAADFSIAQLERLIVAQRDNNDEEVRFVLSQAGTFTDNGIVSTSSVPNAGHQMFAAIEGVNASDYTVSELLQLNEAVREHDDEKISFLAQK